MLASDGTIMFSVTVEVAVIRISVARAGGPLALRIGSESLKTKSPRTMVRGRMANGYGFRYRAMHLSPTTAKFD